MEKSKYNKLLETQITDSKGRYGFLVGNNIFYLTASKPEYETLKTKPMDLTEVEVGAVVAKDLELKKIKTIKIRRRLRDLFKRKSKPRAEVMTVEKQVGGETETVKSEPAGFKD